MSIKFKVAVLLACAALLGGGSISLFVGQLAQSAVRGTVSDQMFTLVTRAADELDDKLEERFGYLTALARGIDAAMLQDPASLSAFLAGREATETLFGIIVFTGRDGLARAYLPHRDGQVGTDYTDRDWFRAVMESRGRVVSNPVIGRVTGLPQVVLAVPIRDAQGGIVGVAAATLELHSSRTLGDLNDQRVGQSGYFYIIGNDRRFIAHHDAERIMQEIPAPGVNPGLDRALAGYEGTLEGVNSRGLHGLFSFKRMRTTGWLVAAVVPVVEAYAVVDEVVRSLHLMILAGFLLLLLLVWIFLWRLLLPLEGLRGAMQRVIKGEDPATLPAYRVTTHDEVGAVAAGFNAMLEAIRERDREVRDGYQRLRGLTEVLSHGVCCADTAGRVTFINPAATRLLHWHANEALGRNVDEVLPLRKHGEDGSTAEHAPWALAVASGETQACPEALVVDRDGGEVHVELTVCPMFAEGVVDSVVITFQDIGERLKTTRHISYLAMHDGLTGLPNRNVLLDRISLARAQCDRGKERAAVLFFDLDGFKAINDNHGHAAGDVVLQECARRIAGTLRAEDSVCRVGGDEFVALLMRVRDRDAAEQVARTVLKRLRTPIDLDGTQLDVTASVGVALYPDDAATPQELVEQADQAMYRAKRGGKDRVEGRARC